MATAGFDALADHDSEILILGTLPGPESLKSGRYYQNGRNSFWKIMADVLGEFPKLRYDDRIAMLRRHKIALWDVLESGERDGSADNAIKNPKPNDIVGFVAAHPSLRIIAFNGTPAKDLFYKHIDTSSLPKTIKILTLPGTSGANRLPLSQKITSWHQIVE